MQKNIIVAKISAGAKELCLPKKQSVLQITSAISFTFFDSIAHLTFVLVNYGLANRNIVHI